MRPTKYVSPAEGAPSPSLFLGWHAHMIDPSDGAAPPLWAPDSEHRMSVSATGLPLLARTALVVHPDSGHDPDLSTFEDEVSGTFPDGHSGTIAGRYFAIQPFASSDAQGNVSYSTDVDMNHNPFNGAKVVSINIAVVLRPIEIRDNGYEWFAIAGAGGVSVPGMRIDGTAAGGGSITFTATLTLPDKDKPPTLSLSYRKVLHACLQRQPAAAVCNDRG